MAAGAVVVALVAWWALRTPTFSFVSDPDRNVLLVTIDTLRADVVGAYGGRARTPNLDRLAAHGARFDFAHAHAVITLPSHASILTGRYPYEHGIRSNTGYRLSAGQPTAATRLKAQGFATGAFIGGFPLEHRFGLNAGFDVYDDRLEMGTGPDSEGRERRADAVVASAVDWISRQSGKWFAWVHVYDPHVPYDPPKDVAAEFPNDPYLGEVSWTDRALGSLFDRLPAEARPTFVVVTGDHGEGLGDHGELTHGIFAYESTLRVPLIVTEVRRGEATARAEGVVIESPVRHVDLLPTLLDAAGAAADPSLPGTSLKDLIATGRGGDRPSYFEAMMAAVARGWAPLRGVLVGHEKYLDLPLAELYDLSTDPKEAQNAAALRPERTAVLYNALKGFSVAPPGQPQQESQDTIARLRSLGYIAGGAGTVRERFTEQDDPKRLIVFEQMMDRGRQAFREGRPAEAANLFRQVIEQRPDIEDAYRKLAAVFWRSGRPGDAVATLELALKNGIPPREVSLVLGLYLAESGQPARAVALLEPLAGDEPEALVVLGTAYQFAGRPGDALRTFSRLVELDATNALAHENIGTILLQARNFEAAERSLRRAIELEPKLGAAYTALGVVLANTGRKPEAIDAWKRAVDLDRRDFNALFNLTAALAEAGRTEEARTYGERFISTAPPALQQDVAAVRRMLGGR